MKNKTIIKQTEVPKVVKTFSEFDSIFIIDDKYEFTYNMFEHKHNIKIIRSDSLVLNLKTTISEIIQYVESMNQDNELPNNIKHVFITRFDDLDIPNSKFYQYFIIKD